MPRKIYKVKSGKWKILYKKEELKLKKIIIKIFIFSCKLGSQKFFLTTIKFRLYDL